MVSCPLRSAASDESKVHPICDMYVPLRNFCGQVELVPLDLMLCHRSLFTV